MYFNVSVFEGAEIVLYGHCMSERELEDALGRELAYDIKDYLTYTDEDYPEYCAFAPDSNWGVVVTLSTEM